LSNPANIPVRIALEYRGKPVEISKSLFKPSIQDGVLTYQSLDSIIPPSESAILFLSQSERPTSDNWIACPSGTAAALVEDVTRSDPAPGMPSSDIFRIATNAPIVAYDIYPYGGASSYIPSSSVLRPTHSWGTSYVAVTPGMAGPERALGIVALED